MLSVAWEFDINPGDLDVEDEDFELREDSSMGSVRHGSRLSLLPQPPDNASPAEFEKLLADHELKLLGEIGETKAERELIKLLRSLSKWSAD